MITLLLQGWFINPTFMNFSVIWSLFLMLLPPFVLHVIISVRHHLVFTWRLVVKMVMDIWHQTVSGPSITDLLTAFFFLSDCISFESEVKLHTHRLSVSESWLVNPYRERPCPTVHTDLTVCCFVSFRMCVCFCVGSVCVRITGALWKVFFPLLFMVEWLCFVIICMLSLITKTCSRPI